MNNKKRRIRRCAWSFVKGERSAPNERQPAP
jgi:hypothetical protein